MKKENKNRKKSIQSQLLSFVIHIAVGVLAGLLIVTFLIQKSSVEGLSMAPSLQDHDVVLVEKVSQYFRAFERGDIVVLDASHLKGFDVKEDIVKRIIGLPGETIRISEGEVYINGVLLTEEYLTPDMKTYPTFSDKEEALEVTLSENEYFCMGDNRENSLDSRILGVFPKEKIKGRAIFRIQPFESFGGI